MRFHVINLPHTQTTKDFINCAYTEKVRRFCNMMKSLDHTVYLYAGDQNEAEVDELITCITEEDIVKNKLASVGLTVEDLKLALNLKDEN